MVRHDWMKRVYRWMGTPDKAVKVLKVMMERWRTRLEVNDGGNTIVRRWIDIKRGFRQGDSYSPVGFCSTEVPIAMLLDETDGYRIVRTDERDVKRTHSVFIDDLKVYQESHKKLEVANEIIVEESMDTVACYGVKKCAEVILSNGKMVKKKRLNVLE